MGLQPDNPVHEASGTESYNYNRPHVIGGQLGFTADQGKRIAGRGARPICGYCNKDFGRVQELNRHLNEQHMPPCRCPFCDFTWTRPNGMKAHLMVRHAEKFTAEMLEAIEALRGRRFIEFIDAYDHLLDLDPEATLQ
jgi:Zinc finger, C2H2 type